jgi:DNA-binding CsgD family transcriptional regulator
MEHLTQRDFRALLSFLREGYAVRDHESFVSYLLSGITRLVPAILVGYAEMNPSAKTSLNRFHPGGIASTATDREWEAHMHEHPVLAHNRRTGDGRALKISDFVDQRAFRRSGLYNSIYRRMGIEDALCFALPSNPARIIGMALHRERRNFTERERRLLNLVRGHLIQAWHNAKAFTEIQKRFAAAQQALEQVDRGVVILDPRGRVRLMTSRARQSIHKYFGSAAHLNSRLPEELEKWIKHHQSCNGEGEIEKSKTPFVRETEDGRLVIRLLPDLGQSLLLFNEHQAGINPARLAQLGLSLREAEVLAWVTRGKTNSEIASIVDLSSRTVQKHLEHIFQKLGVETRTAAAARALDQISH